MEVRRRPVFRGSLSFQGVKLLGHVGKKTLSARDEPEMIRQYLHGMVITLDGIPVENECQYWKAQAALWGLIDHMEKPPNKSLYYYKDMFWRALATLRDPPDRLVKLEREMRAEYYGTPPPTIVPAESVAVEQEPSEIGILESTLDVLAISNIEQEPPAKHHPSHATQKVTCPNQSPACPGLETSTANPAPSLQKKEQHFSSSKQTLPSLNQLSLSSKQPSSSIERPLGSNKQPSSSEQRPSVSKTPLSSTQTNGPSSSTHMPPPLTKAKQQKSARQQTIRIVDPSPEPSLLSGGGELDHKTPIPHAAAKTAKSEIRCYSGTMSYTFSDSRKVNFGDYSLNLSVRDGCDRAIGHFFPFFDTVFAIHGLTYGEWNRVCWGEVSSSNDQSESTGKDSRIRVYQDGRIEAEMHWALQSGSILNYSSSRYDYKGIMVRDGEVSKKPLRSKKELRSILMHGEELLKRVAKLSR